MPKAGTELKDWYQEQKKGNYSGENYINKTKEVLKEYVGDSLASYKNKNNSEDDKKKAEKKVKEFNEKLESDSFKKFVSCIRWSFSEESDTNKEIANLSQDILETIFNELQYDNGVEKELLLGYLVNEVLQKSIEKDEDKRLLNNEMLQNALELTEISDSAFDKDIKELFKNSFFIINEKLDSIKEDTKNLAPIENENLEKRLKEEYETFEEIPLLLDETKQNNIEDDISNIISGMKEKDEKKQNKIKDFIINLETVIKVEDNKKNQKEEKETIQIDTLLERLNKTPKLLIYGDAGIGKTTFCKYIAYKWAKDKLTKFDYVIYLPLRVWESKGLAGAIKDYYYNEEENRSFELIDNIENDSQDILFLFDGYDELNEKKKSDLKQNHLPKLKNYIIVSRPTGYNENEFNIDKAYKSIGYLPNDISEYIDKFFDSSEQNLDLKHFLEQNNSIAYLAHIPLMLEIICVLWMQKKSKLSDSMTMTELYSEVIDIILSKHFKQDKSASTCLKKTRIKYELGKLAFDGLKKQKILFDCNFLAQVVNYNAIDFFETHVIKSGFLKPENTPIEFLHLTFQEYFAAYYVNTLSQDEQREIIKEYKFYPHMQMFFSFLAGLIQDKEFLLREIESEPRDLVGLYTLLLVLDCLKEIKKEFLTKQRIKTTHSLVVFWLKYTITLRENYNTFDYELILKKLESIIHVISIYDDEIIGIRLQVIYDDERFGYFIRGDVLNPFQLLSKDYKIASALIDIVQDKGKAEYDENDFAYIREGFHYLVAPIIEHYLSIDINNDKVYNLLIELLFNELVDLSIKNKVIDYFIELKNQNLIEKITINLNYVFQDENTNFGLDKKNIAKYLILLGKKDDIFFEFLIDKVKSISTPWYERIETVEFLVSFPIYSERCINILRNKNTDLDIKCDIVSSFSSLKKNDDINFDSIINTLIFIVQNEHINLKIKQLIVNFFINLGQIDENIVDLFMEVIEDKNTSSSNKIKAAEFLFIFNKKIENIVKYFVQIVKNTNIHSWDRVEILKFLIIHERNNNQITQTFIKDSTINVSDKIKIAELVISSDKKNKELIVYFQDSFKEEKISLQDRFFIAKFLISLNISKDETIDTLIKFYIQNKNLNPYYKVQIAEYLTSLNRLDQEIINILITIIEDKRSDNYREHASELLIPLSENNVIILKALIGVIYTEDYNVNFRVKIASSVFKNKNILKEIDMRKIGNDFREALLSYASMKNIFEAFDLSLICLDEIVRKSLENKLPLYLKDNNLYTVEKKEKIFTRSNVNEGKIEQLKKEFGIQYD